jgi:type IV pilus assembly protein PilN
MRITLNLASKPFIELGPLYARLRLLMALLLLIAVPLWFLYKTEARQAALANAKLQSVENDIQKLKNQQQSYQAMMRQPQNEAVLTQAAFLNQLFARKSFSWTAVMMDLETVLPGGVQVLNIDPATDKAGNVTIRLRVNGQRDRAVELVRNLEHSKRFLQPRLASESLETSNNGGPANFQQANAPLNVNFDVLADYNPLPAISSAAEKTAKVKKDKSETSGDAEAKPKTAAPQHRSRAKTTVPATPRGTQGPQPPPPLSRPQQGVR